LAMVDTYDMWTSMPATKPWPTSAAAVVNATVTQTTAALSLNGGSSYTYGGMNNNTGTAAGATLGQAPWATGQAWKGRIAEVIVLQSSPTTTQDRAVQEYLARKWGVTIAPAVPGTPTATVASATSASVSWTAPAWDGGASVTSYTVTSSSGPSGTKTCTATAPATTCTVTGLTTGTGYTFTVTATNTVGAGPASSASNSVTPT